jgi:alanine racemase
MERMDAALNVSRNLNIPVRLHIEVETGMNRTGFDVACLPKVKSKLDEYHGFWVLEGLCTHYAGAESSSNYLRVKNQIKKFKSAVRTVKKLGLEPKRLHTACSAAALTYPETIMDMVRIGIALYGYWPTQETYMHHYLKNKGQEDPLKRVLSWKSRVMSTKLVPEGQFIGYGTSYLAGIPTKIATVPVGYAWGFSRNLSNLGRVIVGGKRTAVIGVVNMNMMLADITETPDVKRGDEVVLIGRQNDQEISVSSFSELSHRINYETLVRLPSQIPRMLVE